MSFFSRPSNKAIEAAAQARVDGIVSAARSQTPTAPPRPLHREAPSFALAPSTDLLDQRLVEELAFVRRTLDAIGDRLCEDPVFLSRHHVALQGVDLIGEILGHVGSVIGSADREDAVARIGMVELRNRLNRDRILDDGVGAGLQRTAANPFSAH